MSLQKKILRLAAQKPELEEPLLEILKEAEEYHVDPSVHGLDHPISGGTDVMQQLQKNLRREQQTHVASAIEKMEWF